MPIYLAEHALRLRPNAGQKWRPSNGFEGELFMEAMCHKCAVGSDGCQILTRVFFHKIDEDEYPQEMQIGPDGQPTCTAFHTELPPGGLEDVPSLGRG